MTRAILVTGAGGVGKTTLSAAIAVRSARSGRRTLALTVDPARRLADALGVGTLGAVPTANPELDLLWGAMLDAEHSWDAVARRHADPEVAERLVSSEFFRVAARHFPASQSYAASERMADHLESDEWDVVVVDTPPAAGGIEFFTAPAETRDLVGGRLIRWITGGILPGRRSLFRIAGRPALRMASTVLGSDLLERVAEFLFDLRTTHDSLSRRAAAIERHFREASTLVVTTSDPTPMREAERFFRYLPKVASPPELVLFNRSLPEAWRVASPPADTPPVLADNLRKWSAEAARQAVRREEFALRYGTPVATVPWQPESPTDLHALEDLLTQAEGLEVLRF
ncbi:MAG TPA: ArsA-related P-loop ATPase [Acidimicrobiia bacterium]|nr:ArsA-related P-loop ATPase [Acidimicrobiia bacterium]